MEEMGLVLGVEGWIIIVIILLFLLTPGAMLSTLNALSGLIPSNAMRQLFFFFNLCGWKLKFSEAKQFAPNHTAKWRSKILHTSTVIWGGSGQQSRVTDSWQDGQTGRPEGSLLNQALSRGQ